MVSWLDPAHGPHDELLHGAEAAAFTEEGKIVAVAEGDERFS